MRVKEVLVLFLVVCAEGVPTTSYDAPHTSLVKFDQDKLHAPWQNVLVGLRSQLGESLSASLYRFLYVVEGMLWWGLLRMAFSAAEKACHLRRIVDKTTAASYRIVVRGYDKPEAPSHFAREPPSVQTNGTGVASMQSFAECHDRIHGWRDKDRDTCEVYQGFNWCRDGVAGNTKYSATVAGSGQQVCCGCSLAINDPGNQDKMCKEVNGDANCPDGVDPMDDMAKHRGGFFPATLKKMSIKLANNLQPQEVRFPGTQFGDAPELSDMTPVNNKNHPEARTLNCWKACHVYPLEAGTIVLGPVVNDKSEVEINLHHDNTWQPLANPDTNVLEVHSRVQVVLKAGDTHAIRLKRNEPDPTTKPRESQFSYTLKVEPGQRTTVEMKVIEEISKVADHEGTDDEQHHWTPKSRDERYYTNMYRVTLYRPPAAITNQADGAMGLNNLVGRTKTQQRRRMFVLRRQPNFPQGTVAESKLRLGWIAPYEYAPMDAGDVYAWWGQLAKMRSNIGELEGDEPGLEAFGSPGCETFGSKANCQWALAHGMTQYLHEIQHIIVASSDHPDDWFISESLTWKQLGKLIRVAEAKGRVVRVNYKFLNAFREDAASEGLFDNEFVLPNVMRPGSVTCRLEGSRFGILALWVFFLRVVTLFLGL